MAINPTNIDRPLAENNDGGLKIDIFFALYADIETFPEKNPAATDYIEKATYIGGFTMKSTKKFQKIECVIEKNGLVKTPTGSLASVSAENILQISLDNVNPLYQGFFEEHKNDPMIFVVEDLADQRVMIGSKGLPAYFQAEGEFNTGTAVADDKQMTMSIRSVGRFAPFLDEAVTLPLTAAL